MGTPQTDKMSFVTNIYQGLFRRTSTFTLTILVGALVFERAFDQGVDWVWETKNRGKLWNHIKDKYEGEEAEEEQIFFIDHLDACIFCSFFITNGLHLISSSLHRHTASLYEAGMMLFTLLHGF